ncbi:MAG: EVE domain-containing protein [Desulfobacterales bacterium]
MTHPKRRRGPVYHSSIKIPAIVGVAVVVRAGYQLYCLGPGIRPFDSRSSLENPIWYMVNVQFVADIDPPVTRSDLKDDPVLAKMGVMKRQPAVCDAGGRKRMAGGRPAEDGGPASFVTKGDTLT